MNIFGIGYQEIAVILVVALIVFGPARLPEVAGQTARWIRDAKKMMTEMSGEFQRSAGVNEFKSAIQGEIAGVKKDLEEAGMSVKKDLNAAANTANQAVKGAANTAKGTPGTKPKSTSTTTSTTAKAATSSVAKAKVKASKEDPFAGLVSLGDATPKVRRVAAATTNGSISESAPGSSPVRETSEAVMRARERRLTAGYNRRISAS